MDTWILVSPKQKKQSCNIPIIMTNELNQLNERNNDNFYIEFNDNDTLNLKKNKYIKNSNLEVNENKYNQYIFINYLIYSCLIIWFIYIWYLIFK
jgi:hypothetical protein